VTKGLAVAPPKIGCIMGVSTSMKFWEAKYSRIFCRILLRVKKFLWFSGLQIKSRKRFFYLRSLLANPVCSVGIMWRQGVRIWAYSAKSVNSPALVRPMQPRKPMMSPLRRL